MIPYIPLFILFALPLSMLAIPAEPVDVSMRLEAEFAVSRGMDFLEGEQAENGSWSNHPGITALSTLALHRAQSHNPEVSRRAIRKSLPYIRKFADAATDPRGRRDTTHVYSCAASLLTLTVLGSGKEDAARTTALRDHLEAFLKKRLNSAALLAPGGVVDMPDVSNLHWAIDAVLLTNRQGLDNELQLRVHRFIESCQVSEGPHAGGFAYAPVRNGSKPAVWGSLTWAGIRSLVLVGAKPTGTSLSNANQWLKKHHSSTENPGLKSGGYFYYLYLVSGTNLLRSQSDQSYPNNWRPQLIDQLLSSQKGDGCWSNKNSTWLENHRSLCTAYAILTMTQSLQ